MIDQGSYPNKYVVDTNIIIYTLAGVKAAVWAMKKLEDDDIEVYYSTIVEAELFSFHELTLEQKSKIRAKITRCHRCSYSLIIIGCFSHTEC